MAGKSLGDSAKARTLLEHLLWCEDHTYEEMAGRFERAAVELGERATITPRHLRRLASGERTGTTPATRRVFQNLFGQPIDVLLSPVQDQIHVPGPASELLDLSQTNEKETLHMAAARARAFHLGASGSNLNGEAMDQLRDDVAMLAVAYQQLPVTQFLGQLVETQDSLFRLLEGRQPPAYTKRLLLMAGVTSGILAKVSHDFGDSHAALTQSRTAFLCADTADHVGMRAWIRGLQSLIAYWGGRYHESVRYAQQGASYAPVNTTSVWLPLNEARAWAALGNTSATFDALGRADHARDKVEFDDIDELGGFCTFSRARQTYYAADALAWLPAEAQTAEQFALQALQAYVDTSAPEWAFGDAAGAATDLAIARIRLNEIEGAAETMRPVLDLPPEQRIDGVVRSVNHVHSALVQANKSQVGSDLQEQIEFFSATPVAALPR